MNVVDIFLAQDVIESFHSRGCELVMGASLDPYELHQTRSTLDFVEGLSAHMLDIFPFLSDAAAGAAGMIALQKS